MSALSKTYRQIIEIFRALATDHMQINEFGYSISAWDLVEKDHKFPLLYLQPTDSTINNDQLLLNFYLVCMDLPRSDASDEMEIHSDTLQILNDVVCLLRDGQDDYGISIVGDGINVEPFVEKKDFSGSGWVATITVEVDNAGSICDIPLTSTL